MASAPAACLVSVTTADNGSPWVFALSARLTWTSAAAAAPRPFALWPAFNNTQVPDLGPGYNARTPLTVPVPTGTRVVALTALITGHGDMEFVPSRHVFTVNGRMSFAVSFLDPLDARGCARRAGEGVEPNGYGAWAYGRDGWCNGWAVPAWTADITAAVTPGETAVVAYAGLMYDPAAGNWTAPAAPGGYILLSSAVVLSK